MPERSTEQTAPSADEGRPLPPGDGYVLAYEFHADVATGDHIGGDWLASIEIT